MYFVIIEVVTKKLFKMDISNIAKKVKHYCFYEIGKVLSFIMRTDIVARENRAEQSVIIKLFQ